MTNKHVMKLIKHEWYLTDMDQTCNFIKIRIKLIKYIESKIIILQ